MEVHTRGVSLECDAEIKEVPWHSMCEWNEVYQQIYSDNLEERKNGLESLQVWKARSSILPYAVECTYILLRIQIKDDECIAHAQLDSAPVLEEVDFTMMYCTAITRFLNQILSVDHKKAPVESMYKLASRLNIPQWVVNLRHEASHSGNLPALQTLREAAKVAMTWLHDNYWRNEQEGTSDWIPGLESLHHCNKLTKLVDQWQSVHIFIRAGYGVASKVPEASFRADLFELRHEYLQNKPRSKDANSKNWKLQHALSYIDKQIFSLIKEEDHAKVLLDIIISSQGFLADEEVLSLYLNNEQIEGDSIESLPSELVGQWRELLSVLHCAQLIPELMDKLIDVCSSSLENPYSCKVAALWLRELARSLLKLHHIQEILVHNGVTLKQKANLAKYAEFRLNCIRGNLTSNELQIGHMDHQASIQVHGQYPQLASAIKLPTTVIAPSPTVLLALAKKACLKPTKWCLIYIQSLFDLLGDVMPSANHDKLMRLMKIYMGESENSSEKNISNGTKFHTVASLLHLRDYTEDPVVQEENQEPLANGGINNSNGWVPYSHSGGQWVSSAVGRLPWQHDLSPDDFLLPRDWEPCFPSGNESSRMEVSTE